MAGICLKFYAKRKRAHEARGGRSVKPQAFAKGRKMELKPDGRPLWKYADGSNIACTEKVKVLDENWDEIREAVQAAIDDAVLMGCPARSFKEALRALAEGLESQYPDMAKEEKK